MRQWLQNFFKLEASSGIILFIAALIAMLWANSPFAFLHQHFTNTFLFWINEGLMAIFFLLVGVELKRGFLQKQLADWSQVSLPLFAAVGGMIIPALIYCLINYQNPILLRGWATPVATDIAFAVSALSLFGSRIPVSLRYFLLALAIFDDIGAIIIIALFYSSHLSYGLILIAILLVGCFYLLHRLDIQSISSYLLLGAGIWLALLHSGIHPTIAGVMTGLAIPSSSLHRLEQYLHPWVAFLIMPLFALANAGIPLHEVGWQILFDGVVLGVTLGLLIGKQLGIFGLSWILIKLRITTLPPFSTWLELYGVSLLCGIGFTMSLFLGTLSFQNMTTYLTEVRLGVILGSFLSAIAGLMTLFIATKQRKSQSRG